MRRHRTVEAPIDEWAIGAFLHATDATFTRAFLPTVRMFASPDEARRIWPQVRRAVWERTRRFRVPPAATVIDAVTCNAVDTIRWTWNRIGPYPLDQVLTALADDRRHLAAWTARDPRGARQIAQCLQLFNADLDRIETAARNLADYTGPDWCRPYPAHLNTSVTYSGTRATTDRAE